MPFVRHEMPYTNCDAHRFGIWLPFIPPTLLPHWKTRCCVFLELQSTFYLSHTIINFFLLKKVFFLIGVKLIYNVVSDVQPDESFIHISTLF